MAKNKQGAASQAAPKTSEAGTETAERKREPPGDGAEGGKPANASMAERAEGRGKTVDEKCAICGKIRQAQEDE